MLTVNWYNSPRNANNLYDLICTSHRTGKAMIVFDKASNSTFCGKVVAIDGDELKITSLLDQTFEGEFYELQEEVIFYTFELKIGDIE